MAKISSYVPGHVIDQLCVCLVMLLAKNISKAFTKEVLLNLEICHLYNFPSQQSWLMFR